MKKHSAKTTSENPNKRIIEPKNSSTVSDTNPDTKHSSDKNIDNEPISSKSTRFWSNLPFPVIVAAAIAFIIKALLATQTIGTNDALCMKMFADVSQQIGGIGVYQKLVWWNLPPMLLHVLPVFSMLDSGLGIPAYVAYRFLSIFADVGSLVLVYQILKHLNKLSIPILLLFALSPVSIMVSGFHGNSDPIMVFFILLSVYLINIKQETLYKTLPSLINKFLTEYEINNYHLAGIAMALALGVKTVPVILLPCIIFYLPNLRRRLEYCIALASFWTFASLPFIFQDPIQIYKNTLGYNSFYGAWGLSRILNTYFPYHWTNVFFSTKGKFLVILIIVIVSLWLNFAGKRPALFFQIGLIFSLFLAISPGFNVHYLVWLTPWVVGLGLSATVFYYLTAGVFLFLAYNWWCAGLPWYIASTDIGTYGSTIISYELLCWASVTVLVLVYFIYMMVEKYSTLAGYVQILYQKNAIVVIAVVLISLIGLKVFNDVVINYGPQLYVVQGETQEIRKNKLLEASYLFVGNWYSKAGLYKENIEMCNQILKLNPNNADAYNNICVSHINLKNWDKAIEAGNKALQIRPDYQLARNNVDWAQSQKNANPQ